jgi:hypothetical protein
MFFFDIWFLFVFSLCFGSETFKSVCGVVLGVGLGAVAFGLGAGLAFSLGAPSLESEEA